MTFFQLGIVGAFMLAPKNFGAGKDAVAKIRSAGHLFVGMELLNWGGMLGGSYALYLIPASIAKGISSTQPIFVLIYAVLFAKFWPNLFKEYLGKDGVTKKIILFIFTIIGIFLVAGF